MYITYQIFYIIFLLFYTLTFLFKKRQREGIAMRLGIYPAELKGELSKKDNIWIHAVSVGEVMAAKALIEKIKKELPQYNAVISTVTETGNSIAKKIFGDDSLVIYLPLDLTFAVKRAIETIKPALFIIIETEIWPNLIKNLYREKVPIVLSNGRISNKSYRRYVLFKPILKNILNYIREFHMRTKEDADKIISLGAQLSKVKTIGNLKFDSVGFHIDDKKRQEIYDAMDLKNKKLIVAGSTHPGEEDILLKVYKNITGMHKDISLLIAPRHPERAEEIARLIKSRGFIPVKVSKLPITNYQLPITTSIYILDTIGQLKLFYSLAWLVFVGGSLVKHGGQNMIEPACFAKPIIFGAHTFNFKDIADLFLEKGAALLVKDESSLAETVKMLYENGALAEDMGRCAQEVVKNNQGAAEKTFKALKTILQC